MCKLNLTELKKFEEINKEEALTLYGQGGDVSSVQGSTYSDTSDCYDHSHCHDSSNHHDSSDHDDTSMW